MEQNAIFFLCFCYIKFERGDCPINVNTIFLSDNYEFLCNFINDNFGLNSFIKHGTLARNPLHHFPTISCC